MMMRRHQRQRRRGATLVEAAVVYPILMLIMLGIIVLGLAVFRYQQMAHIAREATRWAAVHGQQYSSDTGFPAAQPQDVYNNAILPQAGGMDPNGLTYSVTWTQGNTAVPVTPGNLVSVITGTDANGNAILITVSNMVSVSVTYNWPMPLFGSIPVTSTSVMPMSY